MNITDKNYPLTPAQKSLLEQSASTPFMLGDFVSLDDILTKLKVDVYTLNLANQLVRWTIITTRLESIGGTSMKNSLKCIEGIPRMSI